MDNDIKNSLIEEAKKAIVNSYSPYSHFAVSAAIYAEGKVYTGVNVENASYSMTICAERNAIFGAVARGVRRLDAICVYHNGPELPYPCGACLQVMSEFCSDMDVIVLSSTQEKEYKLSELLPAQFKLNTK